MQQVLPSVLTVKVKLLHALIGEQNRQELASISVAHCNGCDMEFPFATSSKVYSLADGSLQLKRILENSVHIWLAERSKRITRSTVGRLAKRKPSTQVADAVKQHLYTAFRGCAATR